MGKNRLTRGTALVGDLVIDGGGNVGGSAIKGFVTGTATVDPGNMLANTAVETSVTITGAAAGDLVFLIPPTTLEAGVVVSQCVVASANTVTLRLGNVTTGAINPASATWTYCWFDLT